MNRCPVCNRFTGEPKKVSVGEKCEFVIVKQGARTQRHTVRTGKLFSVRSENDFTVNYRGKLHRVDKVTHPEDPSPLTVAFIGLCTCAGAVKGNAGEGHE